MCPREEARTSHAEAADTFGGRQRGPGATSKHSWRKGTYLPLVLLARSKKGELNGTNWPFSFLLLF